MRCTGACAIIKRSTFQHRDQKLDSMIPTVAELANYLMLFHLRSLAVGICSTVVTQRMVAANYMHTLRQSPPSHVMSTHSQLQAVTTLPCHVHTHSAAGSHHPPMSCPHTLSCRQSPPSHVMSTHSQLQAVTTLPCHVHTLSAAGSHHPPMSCPHTLSCRQSPPSHVMSTHSQLQAVTTLPCHVHTLPHAHTLRQPQSPTSRVRVVTA